MQSCKPLFFLLSALIFLPGCYKKPTIQKGPPLWNSKETSVLYLENEVRIPWTDLFIPEKITSGKIIEFDPTSGKNKTLYQEKDRNFSNLQKSQDGSLFFLSTNRGIGFTKNGIDSKYTEDFKKLLPSGEIKTLGKFNGKISPMGNYILSHDPSRTPHEFLLRDGGGEIVKNLGSPIPNIPYMDLESVKWDQEGKKFYYQSPYLIGQGPGAPPPPETDPNGKIYEYDLIAGEWKESLLQGEDYAILKNPSSSPINSKGQRVGWKMTKTANGQVDYALEITQISLQKRDLEQNESLLKQAYLDYQKVLDAFQTVLKNGETPNEPLTQELNTKKTRYFKMLNETPQVNR